MACENMDKVSRLLIPSYPCNPLDSSTRGDFHPLPPRQSYGWIPSRSYSSSPASFLSSVCPLAYIHASC
ncbi:hypothetical protein EON63_11410 [archaeon]|nr:MAG: hypothetical protein EON63_11410 [archaeon]